MAGWFGIEGACGAIFGKSMTYNFDPERWYDNERAFLDHKLRSGEISEKKYRVALKTLENKLEEMWKRLDGSYQVHEDG